MHTLAVAALALLAAQVLQAAPAPLAVQPDSASPGRVAVELRGAPALALREYLARDSSAVRRDQVFSLAVNKSGARVPMMARLEWSGDTARLLPQAPLTRGITYVAVFEGPKVKAGLPRLTRDYRLPADSRPSSAKLAAVYPNDPVLPANLLKFYLCFSAPMAQGELFKHVRLLDASGKPILQALREVELWSEDHRRATVWISPGRTKSSLGLSEALGPVLKPNARFTLEVTPGLRDTQGRVLKSGFKRAFKTAGYDHQQPRIQGWQVTAPSRGSSEPLVVKFGEPLDHFLAARLIAIQDEQGHPVTGAGQVAEDGRSWTFRPRALWSAGKYAVVAGGELEDLAGNSLLRPFEATTGTAPKPSAAPPVYRREFRVGD